MSRRIDIKVTRGKKNIKEAGVGEVNAKRRMPFAFPSFDRYLSRGEWEDVCWRKILQSANFLESLLTSHERHNLVMRAAVIDGVTLGKRYRQIAGELLLSLQTISSIKKAARGSGYQSYRERSKAERKRRVYSSGLILTRSRKRRGRPQRTKYGTIYMPY